MMKPGQWTRLYTPESIFTLYPSRLIKVSINNEASNSLDSTKTRYSLWKDNYASPGFLDTLLSFSRLAVMFKSWQISSYHVYNLLDFMTAKLSCPCCSFRADSANWSWNSPYNLVNVQVKTTDSHVLHCLSV